MGLKHTSAQNYDSDELAYMGKTYVERGQTFLLPFDGSDEENDHAVYDNKEDHFESARSCSCDTC